jgi:hypothetical protein
MISTAHEIIPSEFHPNNHKGNKMSNWIIHIVGETLDDDLAPAITKFVTEIESLAHRVKQVRLTTDAGEKVIHVAHDVATDIDTVAADATKLDPSLASTATTVEGGVNEADTAVTSTIDSILARG